MIRDERTDRTVAIVGAGPAGLYAATALLKSETPRFKVDVFDRLPSPFGLLRYGVAPDHQHIKRVRAVFERPLRDERLRFFGNVALGEGLRREDLLARYDYVIYATGLQGDRALGIVGEDLEGCLSSTAFVAWYNGHPDYADLHVPLDHPHAIIVGAGNVALDVARILAKNVDELASSDIADHALDALAKSKIKRVTIVARRGPADAKFTTPELKELQHLEHATANARPTDFKLSSSARTELEADRTRNRNFEILRGFSENEAREPHGAMAPEREINFRFFESIVYAQPSDDTQAPTRVAQARLARNRIERSYGGALRVVRTTHTENLDAGLLIRAIGYAGDPIAGLPFDHERRRLPTEDGRLLDKKGKHTTPEYAVGWARRGASGVIGTNKADAESVVQTLIEDDLARDAGRKQRAPATDVTELLSSRAIRWTTSKDWFVIDELERAAGEARGRPRTKFIRTEDYFNALDAAALR